MKTLTIEVPDEEAKVFGEIMKRFNVKVIAIEESNTKKAPNALTVKTIRDANNGKGIDKPIEDIRAFIDSI